MAFTYSHMFGQIQLGDITPPIIESPPSDQGSKMSNTLDNARKHYMQSVTENSNPYQIRSALKKFFNQLAADKTFNTLIMPFRDYPDKTTFEDALAHFNNMFEFYEFELGQIMMKLNKDGPPSQLELGELTISNDSKIIDTNLDTKFAIGLRKLLLDLRKATIDPFHPKFEVAMDFWKYRLDPKILKESPLAFHSQFMHTRIKKIPPKDFIRYWSFHINTTNPRHIFDHLQELQHTISDVNLSKANNLTLTMLYDSMLQDPFVIEVLELDANEFFTNLKDSQKYEIIPEYLDPNTTRLHFVIKENSITKEGSTSMTVKIRKFVLVQFRKDPDTNEFVYEFSTLINDEDCDELKEYLTQILKIQIERSTQSQDDNLQDKPSEPTIQNSSPKRSTQPNTPKKWSKRSDPKHTDTFNLIEQESQRYRLIKDYENDIKDLPVNIQQVVKKTIEAYNKNPQPRKTGQYNITLKNFTTGKYWILSQSQAKQMRIILKQEADGLQFYAAFASHDEYDKALKLLR